MQWLAADGFERLQAAGKIPADEADIIIEEMYNELMNKWPGHKVADYAATHLGKINLQKGNNVKACAYFCWFLMNAEGQDSRRMEVVRRVTEGCECRDCGSARSTLRQSSGQGGNNNE